MATILSGSIRVNDEAVTTGDLYENPSLIVPMKLSSDGLLQVKGQFIEGQPTMSLSLEGNLKANQFIIEGTFVTCELNNIISGSGSGGTTFECFEEGSYPFSMPTAGSGITELFCGTSSRVVWIDDFESYATGSITQFTSSILGFDYFYVG